MQDSDIFRGNNAIEILYRILDDIFMPEREYQGKGHDWWASFSSQLIYQVGNKLFEFTDDSQRTGFLCSLFRRTCDNGKEWLYSEYYSFMELPNSRSNQFKEYLNSKHKEVTEADAKYISYCASLRQEMTIEISKVCLDYESIDFDDVMEKSGIASVQRIIGASHVIWYSKKKPNVNEYEVKSIIHNNNSHIEYINLADIFNDRAVGYQLCLELLKHLDFMDTNGRAKQKVKSIEILGLAVALKESQHNLLVENYTDDQLMHTIQTYLKLPFSPSTKRRGKGYNEIREEAKKFINSTIKKSRET